MSNPALAADRATLEAMVDEDPNQLGARFAILSDAAGTWTIRSGWPDGAPLCPRPSRRTRCPRPTVASRGRGGPRPTCNVVVSEPAAFGEETLGALTIGIALDDAVARELADVTHSEINLITGARVSGSSLDPGAQLALTALLGRGVPDVHGSVSLGAAWAGGLPQDCRGGQFFAGLFGEVHTRPPTSSC